MKRDFEQWLKGFKESIATYGYYVDFEKVKQNVENIKVELNILNSLIGSQNIELEFCKIVERYPETLKCIPLLLAVRSNEIFCMDENGSKIYDFKNKDFSKTTIKEYAYFMKETGLFTLISKHLVNNLLDYVTGVETGLNSNARKNRGGHLMENLVEKYLVKAGLKKNKDYFKEMYISEIEKKWGINLSNISNNGKTEKRFDFVVKKQETVYGIETNFYTSSGSKLNETARSYKNISLESKDISNFTFIWFTDGKGWLNAKHNLEETFEVMPHIYNIEDLENGILNKIMR